MSHTPTHPLSQHTLLFYTPLPRHPLASDSNTGHDDCCGMCNRISPTNRPIHPPPPTSQCVCTLHSPMTTESRNANNRIAAHAIISGEHPEAIQTASASHSVSCLSVLLPLVLILLQCMTKFRPNKGGIIDALTIASGGGGATQIGTLNVSPTTSSSSSSWRR